MARIHKKTREMCLVIEPPPLNLISGKFRYRPRAGEDDYEGQYQVRLRLLEDDSPIRRIELTLVNMRSGAPAGRYVMPVLFWKLLEEQLPEFMGEVEAELDRRGESRHRYKRRKIRDENT